MKMNNITLNNRVMRLASAASELADEIMVSLDSQSIVSVDFAAVETMTPSFANTLLMRLLDRYDMAYLKANCVFKNRSHFVISIMNRAVVRYQSGARLSAHQASA